MNAPGWAKPQPPRGIGSRPTGNRADVINEPFEAGQMQDTDELTTEAIRERMDAHIAAASVSAEIDPANMGLIDDLYQRALSETP